MIDDSIRYDRNIMLFGAEGQKRIKTARVGVAGLGGLGCHMVQQLAYLGVNRYVLTDGDRASDHSLNRLVTAYPDDVGEYKTDLAERLIRAINPDAEVVNIRHHLPHPEAIEALAGVDLILGGLDNDAPRLHLTDLASGTASSTSTRPPTLTPTTGRSRTAAESSPPASAPAACSASTTSTNGKSAKPP
jgi:molybdopterin/thiamine biosynthesis adenylyltransferase